MSISLSSAYAEYSLDQAHRVYATEESTDRTPWQRDRDRILHADSFRRLAGKAQVFVQPFGDHVRTRLTHTLEVSQIARDMARFLHINEDLTEAIALVHDIGHPPFGHIGEEALNECYPPFEHNVQTLRMVVKIEQRYPNHSGLNLTKGTIEGIIKHNFPVYNPQNLFIQKYIRMYGININQAPSLESQCAEISDSLAYLHHDVEDGLRNEYLQLAHVLEHLPWYKKIYTELKNEYSDLSHTILIKEMKRRRLKQVIADVEKSAKQRLEHLSSIDALVENSKIIQPSEIIAQELSAQKVYLMKHFYRGKKLRHQLTHSKEIIKTLFAQYVPNIEWLPKQYNQYEKRGIVDYIAGMGDAWAKQHTAPHTDSHTDPPTEKHTHIAT